MEFHYEPSNVETNMKSMAYIRQNPWGKCPRGVDLAIAHEKIHIPWAHYHNIRTQYHQNGELDIESAGGKRIANVAINMPINSVVYIPGIDGSDGALVRLTSNVKDGFLSAPYIFRTARTCGHEYTNNHCEICRNAIIRVDNQINNSLQLGHIIEPFSTLYRDVELIGRVKIPSNFDKMTGARRDSAGKEEQYWVRVNYYPAV